jgi:HupE / UreJ protein
VMLSFQRTSVPVTASGPNTTGEFTAAVDLGIEHIRTGSDHLLFITMLLLPAPLVVAGSRWHRNPDQRRAAIRVVHVVTAFTIGHSLTLALGAFELLHLPARVVESGIALSVLLSAVHAIRPLARRGEVIIAGSFGLLHGLAFASVLQDLDLGPAAVVKNLLGFNVGIEITQLCVLALVLPSLVLLSRTIVYPTFRISVASVGAALATGWFAARTGLISGNPLEGAADLVVDHPFALAIGTATFAVAAASTSRLRAHTIPDHPDVDAGDGPGPPDMGADRSASGHQSVKFTTTV